MKNYRRIPSFETFIGFLEEQVRDISNPNYQRPVPEKNPKSQVTAFQTKIVTSSQNTSETGNSEGNTTTFKSQDSFKCPVHKANSHLLVDCYRFKSLSYEDKRKILAEHKLCYKCTQSHMSRDCTVNAKCEKCKWNHITLLHKDSFKGDNDNAKGASRDSNDSSTRNVETNLHTSVQTKQTFAKSCSPTVLVEIYLEDAPSKRLQTYAILDSQSSGSFIDPSVVKYFNAKTTPYQYSLITLQGIKTSVQSSILKNLVIRGISYDQTYNLPPLTVIPSIPDSKEEIASPKLVRSFPHISELANNFAEINPNAEVTLLLGRDCGFTLPVVCYGDKVPYVYQTNLGYALVGEACQLDTKETKTCLKVSIDHEHFSISAEPPSTVHPSLPKLPLVENTFEERKDDEMTGNSLEDEKFQKLMSENVKINEAGHITLPLPFKDKVTTLPDNRQAVFCRQNNTLNRLKKEKDKLQQCLEAMKKNIVAGFVEPVPPDELEVEQGKAWWLPIFPVSHPSKKLRLVYDSKAQFQGVSLNDVLMKGPDRNNKLLGVLLRFRKENVGFASDVESMFNQFHVTKSDSNYLRFFWFKNNKPDEPLIQYRAKVHIFGNKPSPAVANFALKYAVKDAPEDARDFIYHHVFVDDGLCSSASPKGAIQTLKNARESLSKVGVRLCKIMSNSEEVLKAFPSSELVKPSTLSLNGDVHGALGVKWDTQSDNLVMINVQVAGSFFPNTRGRKSVGGRFFQILQVAGRF